MSNEQEAMGQRTEEFRTAIHGLLTTLVQDVDETVVPRAGLPPAEPHEATPRRIQNVRRRLTSIRQTVDDLYLETGQLLLEVRERHYWTGWGFESFTEYAEIELRMRDRKALYLMSVAEAFQRLAIQPAEREGLTFSNALEIAAATRDPRTGRPLDITPERREELLGRARTMTQRELRANLREERGLPAPEFVARNFAVQADQAGVIDQALEACRVAAEAQEDELSRGRLLELICAEFLAGTAGIRVQRALLAENAVTPEGNVTPESAANRVKTAMLQLQIMDPTGEMLSHAITEAMTELDPSDNCPFCGTALGDVSVEAVAEACDGGGA